MSYPFPAYLYRLQHIRRWSLMRSTAPENVAQHSFHVALLAHLLCTIANVQFGRSLNADRAAALALFHDAAEVFTGDIATPVKHGNARLLSSFREMEAAAAERLVSMIPEPMRDEYAPLLAPDAAGLNEEEAELHVYVKAADRLDAYLKCVMEVASGNREFAAAKTQTEAKLRESGLPAVAYFLEHMAPSFALSLDELSGGPETGHEPNE